MSGSSLYQDALDVRIAQAEAEGFLVIKADAKTLLLDLDTPDSLKQFGRVLPVMKEHLGVTEISGWNSKSGRCHIRLTMAEKQPWQIRYAMQAALGSDGMREALAIRQMLNGCDEASILFKPANAVEDEDVHFMEQPEEPPRPSPARTTTIHLNDQGSGREQVQRIVDQINASNNQAIVRHER